MNNLQHRQIKIQNKRKKTEWKQFVKEICSRKPSNFYQFDGMISRFPNTSRAKVVSKEEFYAWRDNLLKYGIEYDSWRSFFAQFWTLFKSIPLPSVISVLDSENSDYCDVSGWSKNAYLSFTVFNNCENVCYSLDVKDACHDVYNSLVIWDGNGWIYQSSAIFSSQCIFYSSYIANSFNIWFSTNLISCQECLFCDGLENQSYCINNQSYPKDMYYKKRQEILAEKDKFPQRFIEKESSAINYLTENCSGNMITKSSNIENGYYVYRHRNWRNLFSVWSANWNSNFYDVIDAGSPLGDNYYAVQWAGWGEHIYCSVTINWSAYCFYSCYLDNCSYCFWCIGLINKNFCIFNKQYTKDEWYKKVDLIFTNMENEGMLGDFFPGELNPFYHNDTAAALIEDFTKEEIEGVWYLRRDEEIAVDIPERMEVVEVKDLGEYEEMKDGTWTIDPSILKKVIRDEEWNVYRVIKMEYDFLVKHGLPLPRKHWLERIRGHFRVR